MSNQFEQLNEELQKVLEKEYIEINKEPIYEFADLVPEDTNLCCVLWIDGPRKMKHGKRIKFQNNTSNKLNGDELIPMTISEDPQIPKSIVSKLKINGQQIKRIKQWIILNKEILLAYANGNITTKQFYEKVRPLQD